MKYWLVTLLAVALTGVGALAAPAPAPQVTAEQALSNLLEGNRRYLQQQMSGFKQCAVGERQKLAGSQAPYAIILACSDSRVPPELIFDEGLGALFVVRVAGNVVDPIVLGSIEYAAEHLGAPLIMVLGHERCGAVTATVEHHGHGHGHVGAILAAIAPALQSAPKNADQAQYVEGVVAENIKLVKASLTAKSPVLAALVKGGKVQIVTGKYDLDDGKVTLLDGHRAP